jgi:tRNA G18 (ribose-2'-O)-methylase SpoU
MQFVRISSLDDPRLAAYVSLTELQLRNRLEPSKGIFIAEQPKVIDRALDAHVQPLSFLIEEKWIDSMTSEFSYVDQTWGPDVPVFVGDEKLLTALTGYRLNRGALCAMRRWKLPSVSEICENARRVAVLENIVNHENIGAIMRSAAALDVDAVLVTPSCADPLYRRAVRVSMGTCFQVPWTRIGGDDRHTWPHPGLDQLHDLGFTTAAMALDQHSISLRELARRTNNSPSAPDHITKLALIFGTEGTGLMKSTIRGCDLTVMIPMSHDVDSLNVAASSAVAFWATRPVGSER